MSIKTSCSHLCSHLTGKKLRIFVIRAGFPYHKNPLLYHWLWVFIILPFLDEDSLDELSEKSWEAITETIQAITAVSQGL